MNIRVGSAGEIVLIIILIMLLLTVARRLGKMGFILILVLVFYVLYKYR